MRFAGLLVIFSILSISACATPRNDAEIALLGTCKASLKKAFEIQISESLSDDEKSFKEYKNIRFGQLNGGYSFVEIDDSRTRIEDIEFATPSGARQHLQSKSIDIDLSALYARRTETGFLYCILSPFSGLGSSGSFQRYAALIAIKTAYKGGPRLAGAIVKRPD
ncbi:hypothetical protein [Ideonella oryzae]|uniref:Lipoprotein n=1 Tax=Ideonella oryzae TaxID=2937441 RepID=A0ABT1BRE6_9BURK|nr:hypothetical protein [Ideonella oryzae]MCO5978116.1 hypothetical protein [Ideonella oryzae]